MPPFVIHGKTFLIAAFLVVSHAVFAQQYTLSASYPDGSRVEPDDVFFLKDSCTFFVQNELGDTVKFKTCEWTYSGQFADLEYKPLNRTIHNHTFGFKLDESIKEYSSTQLHRITTGQDNSVCFLAKIKIEGTTETNDNIALEFPVYLNVLPSKPLIHVKDVYYSDDDYYIFISLEVIGKRAESYEMYHVEYDDPLDRIRVSYKITVEESKDYFYTNGNSQVMKVQAIGVNKFGRVKSDEITYSDKTSSTEQEQSIDKIRIYPNPVKDLLYIQGDIGNIRSVIITDVLGRTVRKIDGLPEKTVTLSDCANGNYLITIISKDEKKESFKIVKY